jgi:peptide chain release factor 2
LKPTRAPQFPTFVNAWSRRGGSFDVEGKTVELNELREQASAPDLWNDPDRARAVSLRLSRLETIINQVASISALLDDIEVLADLADEHSDEAASKEVTAELATLSAEIEELERESLFFGEHDDRPAIVSVHAGAGGVDAQDWAEMMMRMYQRFLEDAGFDLTLEEINEGEEAGIKSTTFTVRGDHAYGTMESERGVHRLVRISPFDANARRQTSFAGVDVVPELEDEEALEVNPEELRIDTFRSSGAGGQHVNKTDSAVRITHLPTGIVVSCQNERSQMQNRARAMVILKARLTERQRHERKQQIDDIRGEKGEAAWGRQIRSYVLQPYQLVKDLRTDVETGNVQAVLNGDLRQFVDGYLRWRRSRHDA